MTLLHHLQPICAEALGLHGCNLTLPLTHRHPGAALQHNWGDPSASRALGSATYRLHEDFMRLTKKKYNFEITCFKYENTNLKGDIQQRCLHSSSAACSSEAAVSALPSEIAISSSAPICTRCDFQLTHAPAQQASSSTGRLWGLWASGGGWAIAMVVCACPEGGYMMSMVDVSMEAV
jgi:hypothetical protein